LQRLLVCLISARAGLASIGAKKKRHIIDTEAPAVLASSVCL
jgi:hypothetical protein